MTATHKRMAFMPLELFDNLEYEIHTPQEWVELGAEEGVSKAACAVSLCLDHMTSFNGRCSLLHALCCTYIKICSVDLLPAGHCSRDQAVHPSS